MITKPSLTTAQKITALELSLGYLAPCDRAERGTCIYCNIDYSSREPWDCPRLRSGPWSDADSAHYRNIRIHLDEQLS